MAPPPASGSAARRPVTRMSSLFAQMTAECPHDIQVYGACVASITGGVNRGACDAEFDKLKQCFVRVSKKTATGRR